MALKPKCWFSFFIIYSSSICAIFAEDFKEIRYTIDAPSLQCASQPLEMEVGERFRVHVKHNGNNIENKRGRCRWTSLSKAYDFKEIILEKDSFEEAIGNSGNWNYTCVFHTVYAHCNYYSESTCHVTGAGAAADEGIRCIAKVRIWNPADAWGGWIISICGLLLVFTIAVGLWIGVTYMMNRLRKNNSLNMNHQNLPEQYWGPMATTTQWNRPEEVAYEEPNSIYNLYAEPTPQSNRIKIEPAYAEPGDSMRQHTYINVHQRNDEPTCAFVQYDEPTCASLQPTYANQNIAEFQNLNTFKVEVEKNKEKSDVDISKDSDGTSGQDYKSNNSKRGGQNSSDNAYTKIYHEYNEISFDPTKMPAYSKVEPQKTYVNPLEDVTDKNHGYENLDVNNDVKPAYCEIGKNNEINPSSS